MKIKCLTVFVCLALLISHSAYAQVPGGENSRECANFDHCADRAESSYRWAKIGCTAANVLGQGSCAVIGTGAGAMTGMVGGIASGFACGMLVSWLIDRCRDDARSSCRRSLSTCKSMWNQSGRCFSNVCD